MASHHTGSDKLLEIRTEYVDVVIKSKGRQAFIFGKEGDKSSSLKVVGQNLERISVPILGYKEVFIDHKGGAIHEYPVTPLFFEQTDYLVTIQGRSKETLEFRSNSSLIEGRVNRVMDDNPTLLTGVINFGNNVGYSDLIVLANGRQVLSVRMEVYPTKVSYKEDYQAMMTDINNMVSEAVLDFMKKTYQVFVPNHKKNEIPAVFFTVLQTIYEKYIKAVNRIIMVPHHKLITEHEVLPYYKVKRIDNRSKRWVEKHPEYVRHNGDTIQAERILSARKRITYDTQENRLVRFMLQSTVKKIDEFTYRYINRTEKPEESILNGVRKMEGEIRRLLTTTFLKDVSDYDATQSMSLVFGMAPGYRELYKYYLMLQNGISVGGEAFRMSVRETAQLYEYWCFIKLYDILRTRYTLKSPDIIKVDRSGVTINLVRGAASKVDFLNTKTGERICLAYNPSESKTPTGNQRPDNTLELEKKGSSSNYKYVFDAKYRIEMEPNRNNYPGETPGPKIDDINTMHRYRDAIVYKNPESRFTFEKTMYGAYILFPYTKEDEYKDHPLYKSIETVNIGGLPFLPSATSLVTELLDDLISESSASAFERAVLPKGIEKKLKKVDWDTTDVLIGNSKDEKHFRDYIEGKYYYTDKRNMNQFPIQYIALYQNGKGIRHFGKVRTVQEIIRDTSDKEGKQLSVKGYRFSVFDWEELPQPISPSEFAPRPIGYTNYFLLTNSERYSELYLHTEDEYRLYFELKRRAAISLIKKENEDRIEQFIAADFKIAVKDGKFVLLEDNGEKDLCLKRDFAKRPGAKFKEIMAIIKNTE